MSTCDACGKSENMPYRCNHCGGTFCSQHRLPEAHDCPGLDNWGDPDGVFDSGFDDSVGNESSSRSRVGRYVPDTGAGGLLGYFRGNVTYLMLGLMWITFLLQYLVYPLLLDAPFGSPLWNATFVLRADHPFYVWTWITSIFAHGGLGHIALNSIVIFFFGRIVERYVGSKQFAALFLISGALAGLGQIGLTYVQFWLDMVPTLAAGVYGASGAGLAIMGTLTVLRPDLRVYLWFLIPVPIWAITGFYFVISIAGIFGTNVGLVGANVANAAHLVGLLIGLAYGQRVKGRGRMPDQLQFGGGGPGGPGGPGRRRGPF